tara:strand:+ start:2646 stop:2942 length:297 start_codon:yes stop_codon:yes gene_type:complete
MLMAAGPNIKITGKRSDGRSHDTGLVRPYRECPDDFRETYVRMGWDGIAEHYRTNWRVITRWIHQSGGHKLRAERRAYVQARFKRRRMEREAKRKARP